MQPLNLSPSFPSIREPPRILIVDDEPDALELYGLLLSRINPAPEVLAALSGEQALEMWEREKTAGRMIDLVVSDLYFGSPSLTGLTLIDELHKGGYRGKTALLTADEEAKDLPASMFGIDWVWMKPYDAMRLGELVTEALNLAPMQNKEKSAAPVTWKTKSPVVDYLLLSLVGLLTAVSVFNLWRSAFTVGMIQEMHTYVLKTPDGERKGARQFEAYIPVGKSFYKPPMARTGEVDVTLRVPATDAALVRSIATKRNKRLRVWVQP